MPAPGEAPAVAQHGGGKMAWGVNEVQRREYVQNAEKNALGDKVGIQEKFPDSMDKRIRFMRFT